MDEKKWKENVHTFRNSASPQHPQRENGGASQSVNVLLPFFFVSLLRYWTRWPLWRHRVALFAAVGVFNTTTARKKMMKILEIGNILMTLSRPRSELSGSSRHSQGRMHRRFLSIGNRYIMRSAAKFESASRVRINTLTCVNSNAFTGLRKSP